jgi:hypothetical protein
MPCHQRKIYHSENGDSWWLCREEDGRISILHEASLSAGGNSTKLEIAEFLAHGKAAPAHHALLGLIGDLTKAV